MNQPAMQRVVIFGATSAIAQAVARRLLREGSSICAVGRDAAKLQALVDDLRVRAGPDQRVESLRADLDRVEGHAALLDAAAECLGGIDVVFIAQGTLPDQAACETAPELALAQIHTNGGAPAALALRAAEHLGPGGMLVAIGSVAGDRGRQSNYVYGAAKGMLALFLQGLRNRLAARGVHVLTVKPGFVDTPMTAAFDKRGPLWAMPDQVAAGIVRAMHRRRDVVYVPGFWRWIMLLIRAIPEGRFKKMKL